MLLLLLLLPVGRSDLHRRALAPIHHRSVRHQSGMGPQLWERREEGEKMETFSRARCGHRLQEFQIILEMHKNAQRKDKRTARKTVAQMVFFSLIF